MSRTQIALDGVDIMHTFALRSEYATHNALMNKIMKNVSDALRHDEWQPCDFSDIAYGEEYELRHTYVKEQAHGHACDVIIERGPARYYRRVNITGDI